MTMIERIARALIESDKADLSGPCACLGKDKPDDPGCRCQMRTVRRRAKAAVKAMREPTDEMFKNCDQFWADSHHKAAYQSMIDAILTEKSTDLEWSMDND